MIKALQPLGATNTIHILASYSDDGQVVVTVSIIPKDDKLAAKAHRTLQISGPVDEVEAALPGALQSGVDCVAKFQTNLAELEAANKKTLAESADKPAPAAPKGVKRKAEKSEPKPADETAKTDAEPPSPAPETGTLDLGALIAAANAKVEKK